MTEGITLEELKQAVELVRAADYLHLTEQEFEWGFVVFRDYIPIEIRLKKDVALVLTNHPLLRRLPIENIDYSKVTFEGIPIIRAKLV